MFPVLSRGILIISKSFKQQMSFHLCCSIQTWHALHVMQFDSSFEINVPITLKSGNKILFALLYR